jgi:glycosyltransferase involved in cell wall biosynthesis/GT2 family glycosyltransferase
MGTRKLNLTNKGSAIMFPRIKELWRRLPISIRAKQRIRSTVFSVFPFLFRNHPAYKTWLEHRRSATHPLDSSISDWGASVPLSELPPPADPPVRILAFYLPQYHPIPENDEWWGKGFTEWRNVIRGQPRFVGHYQPHLPGELGFYDLRVPEVQARQVELAKLYGIAGFVFYFYWFGGRRLLERPLLHYLADPGLDLRFCLCWANESWSRRWDGRDRDVLMPQIHSPADDLAFIEYVTTYFTDRRYIRVGGRPLLIVYRPDLFPNARETAERWRSWCRTRGVGDIFLAYTQSFESKDPTDYGFDAAVEFPPNNTAPRDVTKQVELLGSDFGGIVYDWGVYPQRSRSYAMPGYKLFRGVNPSWDNEARRPNRGATFYGSSPGGYREWLENAIEDTVTRFSDHDERLVFVNAWNEWAEGAHLEPDQRYGYAYLQATRDALVATRLRWRRDILIVSHDALPHGAQYLALHMAQELSQVLGYRVQLLSLGSGPLMGEYARYAKVHLIDIEKSGDKGIAEYVAEVQAKGINLAIVNTTASTHTIPFLKQAGIKVLALVHELPDLIHRHGLEQHARIATTHANVLVFPAELVRDGYARFGHLSSDRVRTCPQGLYKRNRFKQREKEHARVELRRRLRLDPAALVVLGVGFGDKRKGFDLFVASGIQICLAEPRAVCLWVGMLDSALESEALMRIDEAGLLSRFVFPGHESETDLFYAGADVYSMTSREDPFPSVVLEALDAGLPVVGFRGAGGFSELEGTGCVILTAPFDTNEYASAIVALLTNRARRDGIAKGARALIQRDFSFRRYLLDLLNLSADGPPRISVVVPNFNYRTFLPDRILSIKLQTMPIYEVIVLDDASSDGSQEWLANELSEVLPDAQVVVNETNSGSVFEQWRRGVSLARGDYVWIAEADDLAKADFLAEVIPAFADPAVVLSYAQSEQIDDRGRLLAADYQEYVDDISETKWRHPYVAGGLDEIRECLAIKNTIPNVSAVVFRRDALAEVLETDIEEIKSHRVAGDWVTYVKILQRGRIAFCPKALNQHRRHSSGVTISGFGRDQLEEIVTMQARIGCEFSPDPPVKAKALGYAARLYQQFGLATSASPTIYDDPLLAPMLLSSR